MLRRDSLQVVHEQLLVLWEQVEHHSQPIENQQEAFTQRSLVCAGHTHTHTHSGLWQVSSSSVSSFAGFQILWARGMLNKRQRADTSSVTLIKF